MTDLADRTLGHWALGGISVLGQAQGATIYGMTEGETLAIRDREMVSAIAAVSRDLDGLPAPARAPTRRLPAGPILAVLLAVGFGAVAPGLLKAQAARMVPPARATELGEEMLIGLVADHGAPCDGREVRPALARLAAAVAPARPPDLRVVPLGAPVAILLPGGTVVVDRAMVAGDPPAAITAARRALADEPVVDLMRSIGLFSSLRYLLSGQIPEPVLQRAAQAAVDTAEAPSPPANPASVLEADRVQLRASCG